MGLDISRRCVRIADAETHAFLGSGFRLSARRVLSAKHVVADRQRVTVLDLDWDQWTPTSAAVLWHSDTGWSEEDVELDAVLLGTDPVQDIAPWTHFLQGRTRELDRVPCQVIGFPGTEEKRPEERETLYVTASFYADSKTQVQLSLHGGEPDKIRYWKGISGSPVLVQDSEHLAAVLMQGSIRYQGRKLWAVPVASLLELPDFAELLEKPDLESHVRPYLANLETHLERHGAGIVLSQQRDDWDMAWRQGRSPQLAKTICLETPLNDQAKALCNGLIAAVDRERWAVASEIYEVLRQALPVAFLQELGEIPSSRWEQDFEVSVTTEAMIEVALASYEKRPIWLRDPFIGKFSDIPKGQLNVSDLIPIENSIDPDGTLTAKELTKTLAMRLGFPEDPRSQDSTQKVLDYIVRLSVTQCLPDQSTLFPASYVESVDNYTDKHQDRWREEFLKIVNGRLATIAESVGKAYYIANPNRKASQEFLRELRQCLPELGFVRPSSTSAPHLEDVVVKQIQAAHLKFHQSKKDGP